MKNNVHIIIICTVLSFFGTVGCANSAPVQKSDSPAQVSGTPENHESFRTFHEQFVEAINQSDWKALIALTKFPFIFRGQLDFEGEIRLSEQEFVRLFPKFLELEAFLDVEGASIPTTYRVLATTPVDEMDVVRDERVEIHDFVFANETGYWQFIQVYTDLDHISEIQE